MAAVMPARTTPSPEGVAPPGSSVCVLPPVSAVDPVVKCTQERGDGLQERLEQRSAAAAASTCSAEKQGVVIKPCSIALKEAAALQITTTTAENSVKTTNDYVNKNGSGVNSVCDNGVGSGVGGVVSAVGMGGVNGVNVVSAGGMVGVNGASAGTSTSGNGEAEVSEVEMVDCEVEGSGNLGAGPSPPSPAGTISYATAAGGVLQGSSSSLDPGNYAFRRRFLEALKKGERMINVEGREVELSYLLDKFGLAAFQEKRGGGLCGPSRQPGRGSPGEMRFVCWRGDEVCPSRTNVVKLLMKMDFRAIDSFVLPEGLELFWSNYELVKEDPGWRGFAVEAISHQSGPKKVTVLTCNESLSGIDIMPWLSRYGEVVEVPKKNLDDFGI
ncbi:uncharacterized protein [Phyllobates terribilis]|uniref:uncharacterized protein isoform X1 n=1 Tax=Phyllobates terribilis TaxID=111132 RepID=UPI003CCB239A